MNTLANFSVGQRVKNQWNQSGTVTGFKDEFVQVKRDGESWDSGWFPYNLTSIEPVPAPVNPESKFGFTVGQRVIINWTDQPGVVTGFDGKFVRVQRDRHVPGDPGGWYPYNLRPEAGSPSVPSAVNISGLGGFSSALNSPAATTTREKAYLVGKRIAEKLGKEQRYVTSDNVQSALAKLGYTSADLGNAAGNLFRGKQWKSNGYVTTARETGRGRKITKWEYVGNIPPAVITPVSTVTGTGATVTIGSIRVGDRVAVGPNIHPGLLKYVKIGDQGTVKVIHGPTAPYPVEVQHNGRSITEVYKYSELVHA